MKHECLTGKSNMEFPSGQFQKYLPIFQRLGLKPRRYFSDNAAAYAGTSEGWYRLGFKKYNKQELKWIRRTLEYLNKRSFQNWAVPWQKTIIWEENNFCYLIQPWLFMNECFQFNDPASVSRIAEIIAELHSFGKDYFEDRGLTVVRDNWQAIDLEWENALEKLNQFKNDTDHLKLHKDVDELRKDAIAVLNDSITSWQRSGLSSLLEHHKHAGVLGHGNLLANNIIWGGNDYYLLNWEGLAFQPRIVDLATLINDVAYWESDWILFLLNEYSKFQPFWPEEQAALYALLKYPQKVIDLFAEGVTTEELDHKNLKEVAKELNKKERCLIKAWKELGTQKRWLWGRQIEIPPVNQSKISMVLSPIESWGDFTGQVDSLIQIDYEQKLPKDVMERLTYNEADQVVAGRDGNIFGSTAKNDNNNENFVEIVEPQPQIPNEKEAEVTEELKVAAPLSPAAPENSSNDNNVTAIEPQVIHWAKFPTPVEKSKKIGQQ